VAIPSALEEQGAQAGIQPLGAWRMVGARREYSENPVGYALSAHIPSRAALGWLRRVRSVDRERELSGGWMSLSGWRAYDNIARRYDDVWGRRFEVVARHLWTVVSPAPGASILDIGTGTGIVPSVLGVRLHGLSGVVGCDRSTGMLARARVRVPVMRLVAAEATHLPFYDAAFDVATASFVLSHLPDYRAGLLEAHRVLKPLGIFAMTGWTPSTDPYSQAWGRLLAEAVSQHRLQQAVAQVAPSEAYFESAANVEAAFKEAGFSGVEVHTLASEWTFSLELFLADRELSSGGRFARHVLGTNAWEQFVAKAREALRRQFGSHFSYSRGFSIGLGRRA